MTRFTTALVIAGAFAAIGAPVAAAHDEPDVPAHQHFIITPNGEAHNVGPNACDNPNAQHGFNKFHYNVHFGQP